MDYSTRGRTSQDYARRPFDEPLVSLILGLKDPGLWPRDKGLRTGICFPSQWWLAKLSRDEAPGGSLPAFTVG